MSKLEGAVMPDLLRLNLEFKRSPIHHVTSRFVSQEHSAGLPENDTIVAAAAASWTQVTGVFPTGWFDGDGKSGIACSSLLPVLTGENGKQHLYLPIPPKSIQLDQGNEQQHLLKVVNKIRWLRDDVWNEWANGDNDKVKDVILGEFFAEFENRSDKSKEAPFSLSEYDPKWVKKHVQERVLLQPSMLALQSEAGETKASMPYRVTSFHFSKGASAAILVDAGEHKSDFLKAIAVLGRNGLGGDRTYGYGQFEFNAVTSANDWPESGEGAINLPDNPNAAVTLGLTYPGAPPPQDIAKSLENGESKWSAVLRQGRNVVPGTNHAVLTRSVRMIGKGAVLAGTNGNRFAIGSSVNVFPQGFKPDQSLEEWQMCIWRSGRTIALPVRLPLNRAAGGEK